MNLVPRADAWRSAPRTTPILGFMALFAVSVYKAAIMLSLAI